jgi:hypothetical protein
MTTLYQPTHYAIHITPTFTKDGTEYKFEGLDYETRTLFRFIVLTLRKYLGFKDISNPFILYNIFCFFLFLFFNPF